MAAGNTIQQAANVIAEAMGPLAEFTEDEAAAHELLRSLGYLEVPAIPVELLDLGLAAEGVASAHADVLQAGIEFNAGSIDESALVAALASLLGQVSLVVNDINRLQGGFASLPADYRAATGIADQIEKRLVDAMAVDALRAFPTLEGVARALGFIEYQDLEADASKYQPEFTLRVVFWDRITDFLSGSSNVLRDVYGWGTPELDTERLFEQIMPLSFYTLSPAEIRFPRPAFLNAIAPGATIPDADTPQPMLVWPLASNSGLVLAIAILGAPKQTAAENQALAFIVTASGLFSGTFPLTNSLSVEVEGNLDLATGVGGRLHPDDGLTLFSNPNGTPAQFAGGQVAVKLAYRQAGGGAPIELLKFPGGALMDAAELFLSAGLDAAGAAAEVVIKAGIDSGRLVYPSDQSDGFTKALLPSGGLQFLFDLGVGWSSRRGLFFFGAGGLSTVIPLNVSAGPFFIDALKIGLFVDGNAATLDVGIVGGAELGPITVIVDALTVNARADFVPGNVGPIDLSLGFGVPKGYGIRVDAGPVVGGGFVYFDDPTYFGAVELSVLGIGVKAFALIETQLPDGSEGFSFAIVISAEFTPIQLGFGFTLLGVGGLLGVNRSVDIEALGAAARTGSLAHLLFPRNVVQDAPAIVHDLATVFPAARGHYVIAPMAKFGWGTPTLITGSFGVLLELPGPRLGLIGVVRLQLPDPEAAILSLQMAMQGSLDFPAKLVSVDAGLFDSAVAGFPVAGDMAYRLGFGNNAKFLMSIGGFNPDFDAPPSFPELRRASVELGVNGNPSLTASGYFALTSNTAQIGARVDLRASGFGIRLTGWLGFDALFVFSPFSFQASFSAGMRVSFHGVGIGVTLRGTLSGTNPWMITGRVCVSVLWWDACLRVDHTFGNRRRAALPEIDPWEGVDSEDERLRVVGVRDAVSDPRNWSGSNPPAGFSVVSLSQAATEAGTPIDPLGAATLRQRVVPLGEVISKFGEYKPVVHNEFTVETVAVNSEIVPSREVVEDDFAPAHFFELSDAEKLSTESYQKMDAGFTIDPERTKIGSSGGATLDYETDFITADGDFVHDETVYGLSAALLLTLLTRGGAASGGIRRSGGQKYVTPNKPKKVTFGPPRFRVVDACTSTANNAITGTDVSQIRALLALRAHVAAYPEDANRYRVVPTFAVLP